MVWAGAEGGGGGGTGGPTSVTMYCLCCVQQQVLQQRHALELPYPCVVVTSLVDENRQQLRNQRRDFPAPHFRCIHLYQSSQYLHAEEDCMSQQQLAFRLDC